MNSENFIIREEDLELAQETCKLINNPYLRNKAVANSLAANIAEQFFDKERFYIDVESGLHNIDLVLEDINISDIYVNNSYIDVRVYFDNSEPCIPLEHFKNDLLPEAYMFIRLDKSLTAGTVTGFMLPENVNKDKVISDYYVVDELQLVPFSEIELSLPNIQEGGEIDAQRIFAYIDNSLSDKNLFYKELLLSKSSRFKLAQAIRAQHIFNFVSLTTNEDAIVPINENLDNNFEQELSSYQEVDDYSFSTVISPSFKDDESEDKPAELQETILNGDTVEETNIEEVNDEVNDEAINKTVDENEQQIDALFDSNQNEQTDDNLSSIVTDVNNSYDENFIPPQKAKGKVLILLITAFVIVAGIVGYLTFTKTRNISNEEIVPSSEQPTSVNTQENTLNENEAAMPIENVETMSAPTVQETGNAVSIPAIEQNIDASVLVSKLKVEWEVPNGYASNTSAQRYLIKLGKIIQLNLKTELLLLSKPPITNKIAVEIKYNKNDKQFETVGIAVSSGEKSVDDLILQTVNRVLAMRLNINSDSFAKLQGNPLLIIHL